MNRYIVDGILRDLERRADVLVIAPTLTIAAHALDEVARRAVETGPGDRYAIRRAHRAGTVQDNYARSTATFTSVRPIGLGHADADVVVVYGYRQIIDNADPLRMEAAAYRLRDMIGDRETVVVD